MARHANAVVLDAAKIVETIERLEARIEERFSASGLARTCASLAATARVTTARARRIARPYFGLRLLALLVVIAGIAAQVYVAHLVDWVGVVRRADPVGAAQGLEAVVNLLILAFGALWFVLTLEARWKRRRVLAHLYEFRSLAHVIDMHQLTKDPTVVLSNAPPTPSSPERRMSEFQLSRYLDYCAEMLALIAKLAALYAEGIADAQTTAAINDIEQLTSSLGRKIWQKIMILSQLDEARALAAVRKAATPPARPDLPPRRNALHTDPLLDPSGGAL